MAGSIQELLAILIIAIGLNLILGLLAGGGYLGLSCPTMSTAQATNETFVVGNVTYTSDIGWKDILNIATGRCQGLPLIVVLLVELPLLVGLAYGIRMFAGFT